MNEPTCKDCPCYQDDPTLELNGFDASGWCRLLPDKTIIYNSDTHWCYVGRLVMAADSQGALLYEIHKLFDPYGRGMTVEGDF